MPINTNLLQALNMASLVMAPHAHAHWGGVPKSSYSPKQKQEARALRKRQDAGRKAARRGRRRGRSRTRA